MEHLRAIITARLTAQWERRSEIRRRLAEDQGSVTTDTVLWVAGIAILAVTVVSILSSVVIAKAKSIHL